MRQFHLTTILTNYLHVSVILVVSLLSNFQQLPRQTMNVLVSPLPQLKQCTAYHNIWDQITLSILRCLYKSQSFWLHWDLSWSTPDKSVNCWDTTCLAVRSSTSPSGVCSTFVWHRLSAKPGHSALPRVRKLSKASAQHVTELLQSQAQFQASLFGFSGLAF